MLDLFAEGFAAIKIACTLALVVPGIAPVVLARSKAWVAAVTFTVVAAIVGWLRVADLFFDRPGEILLVPLALAFLGALVMLYRAETERTRTAWAAGAAAMAALIAAWTWVPCVGEHFADPLNRAATERLATIGPIFVYLLGVCIPLLVAAAIPHAWPRLTRWRDHDTAKYIGIGLGALVALAIAAGFYLDIIEAIAPQVVY